MLFTKETSEIIREEYRRVMEEIRVIQPTKIRVLDVFEVTIFHNFLLTMIDGKIINTLSENTASSVSNL